jgi:hypothetical protein
MIMENFWTTELVLDSYPSLYLLGTLNFLLDLDSTVSVMAPTYLHYNHKSIDLVGELTCLLVKEIVILPLSICITMSLGVTS